jgi:hypothetical protein
MTQDTPTFNKDDESAAKSTTKSSSSKASPGPTSAKGKAISSQNARKHGIFSSVMKLKSDSRAAYDSLLNGLYEYFDPKGTLEEILVEKLAILTWRYRRLVATETEEIEAGDPLAMVSTDSAILGRFPRYETSIDRAFDRTLTQLERYQRMRKGQSVPPPISVDISS